MMKGKKVFTAQEIKMLKELIIQRNNTPPSGQKAIRQKMRKLGFYGEADWCIRDLQLADLDSLIRSDRIQVIREGLVPMEPTIHKGIEKPHQGARRKTTNQSIDKLLAEFAENCFDPSVHNQSNLPSCCGNYIICLKKKATLPTVVVVSPAFREFAGLKVIYTGIASRSLRSRDYKQHFTGNNAGRSTLRKSLGVLFGYKQVPRDRDPLTGKTKFFEKDEEQLSKWMQSHLVMYFLPATDFLTNERKLIAHFNPPLNLQGNHGLRNLEYRRLLSKLRREKADLG
jgi:hypothetical protein